MICNTICGLSEQSFLLLLWIMAIFSAVVVAILELIITIWAIAEVCARLHAIKLQQRRHTIELRQFEQQNSSIRHHIISPTPQQASTRRAGTFRGRY